MGVSKRTRFEILRRDDYACRYCGAKAPDATLQIDHIVPQALGGSDDPTNLVTSCDDCNAGKSSMAPDHQFVADVDEMAAKWTLARQQAAAQKAAEEGARRELIGQFRDAWADWDKSCDYLPDDWERSIGWWLDDGLTIDQIIEAYYIALGKKGVASRYIFRYMAGICRNMIADLDKRTRDHLGRMAD